MMRFTDVSYSYPSAHGECRALDAVSLEIGPGETVAVLGANGSGKSTLARLANGMLLPDVGLVSVNELDTADPAHAREVRRRVGVVLQHPDDQIVATAVEDDVAFGPENLSLPREEIRRRVDEAIAAVGLTGLERREPHLLSGGQKQRLAIAGALAMQPEYLVFDEPSSMLDPEGRAEVAQIIRQLAASGRGVLLITHDLSEIASADRVLVLDAGRAAFADSVAELLGRPDVLDACGLELPPLAIMAETLRAAGVAVDAGIPLVDSLVEAACR
jgi:energy-coupling factor transport system ATP-binding protein